MLHLITEPIVSRPAFCADLDLNVFSCIFYFDLNPYIQKHGLLLDRSAGYILKAHVQV